ncbi:hypothetical protein ENBRE01_2320 [Enteropsectra breve]|nr:hypothetical protein ENBRE01_2320 [Enteropsectra breve]
MRCLSHRMNLARCMGYALLAAAVIASIFAAIKAGKFSSVIELKNTNEASSNMLPVLNSTGDMQSHSGIPFITIKNELSETLDKRTHQWLDVLREPVTIGSKGDQTVKRKLGSNQSRTDTRQKKKKLANGSKRARP